MSTTTETAELERLRDACRLLGKVVHRDCRVLEAARIELLQNGPHAAMQWVLSSLDGTLDEDWGALKWDGTESAQEWFDRVCEADAVAAAADRVAAHAAAIGRLLALRLPDNDSGARTVRGYLAALLAAFWGSGEEGLDGKKPFGNSDWRAELYLPMAQAGLVEPGDEEAAAGLILAAIKAIGGGS